MKSICGIDCAKCELNSTCNGCAAAFNALSIQDMEEVTELNALKGSFANIEYALPNGPVVKFWDDKKIYLGNQLHKEGSDRCYRIIADEKGEYVSYVGMWWTSENHLAYLEPPCTIPEYRHKGLTAAALSEMYRRTKS